VVPKSSRDDNFNKESEDLSNYLYVKEGDLVLNKMKTWQGSLAVSRFEGIVSPAYFVCQLSPQVEPRFIHYLLRSEPLIAEYAKRSKGIRPNQWDLPFDEFKAIEVTLPPVEEQRKIADFLDDQVARIDVAIVGKRQEAAAQEEMYWSRLAQAVGAEPTPSFLEGLEGEGVRLGLLCNRMVAGGTPTSSDESLWADDGVPWISIGDMVDGGVTESTEKTVSAAGLSQARLQVQPEGALLLAMYASVGKVSLSGMPAVWNQAILGLTLREGVPQDFVVAWLELARPSLPAIARSATQDNLNADQVRRLRVPRMDSAGMEAVARARSGARTWLAQSSQKIEQSVALLEERKRSLITAAVTGELDVTAAKPIGMGKWVPNVGAGLDTPAAAQASSIGGIG